MGIENPLTPNKTEILSLGQVMEFSDACRDIFTNPRRYTNIPGYYAQFWRHVGEESVGQLGIYCQDGASFREVPHDGFGFHVELRTWSRDNPSTVWINPHIAFTYDMSRGSVHTLVTESIEDRGLFVERPVSFPVSLVRSEETGELFPTLNVAYPGVMAGSVEAAGGIGSRLDAENYIDALRDLRVLKSHPIGWSEV